MIPEHDTLIAMFAAVSALATAINSALLLRLKRGQGEARDEREGIAGRLDQAIETLRAHEQAAATRASVLANWDGIERRVGPPDRREATSSPGGSPGTTP